jgi:hypothetical protein
MGTSLEQIKQDSYFPADLLFLSSTNPDGVCYIEVNKFILTHSVLCSNWKY